MGMKNNRFIHPLVRKRLSLRSPPMNLIPGLKKMLLYKTEQVGIGTLTRSPPMGFRAIRDSFTRLPTPSRFLGSHRNKEKTILSRFTLGV